LYYIYIYHICIYWYWCPFTCCHWHVEH
jgi:hypothetical protein